ncbi:uncharacterized protein LOC119078249 [Bradysia coprophila]|uniref:uncharacterized protein LOC119078249 n=1 Tax=Bradysia coprophila TaxID=38358 RepID=UPI00187D7075|nr:uncharacterized protein LOC119078249 [Bradysia coprophila]
MNLHGLFDKFYYLFLGFVAHLISIGAYLIVVASRFIVNFLLDKNEYRMMEPGSETIMAEDTKGSNVLYVLKCTGTPNVDKIVDKLYRFVNYETTLVSGGRVDTPYRPFEKLGYRIVKKLGTFCWNVNHNFRAEDHLVIDKVNRSLDVEIHERCEVLTDTIYANHKPQWEMHILDRDESKEYAIVWSVHHSYTDGTSFTQAIRYAFADDLFPIKIDALEWNRKEPSFCSKITTVIETLLLCSIGSGWFASVYGQCLGQAHVRENDLTEMRGRSHCRAVTLNLTELKTIQRKLSKENPVRLVSVLFAFVSAAFERAISSSKLEKPSTILAGTVEADYPYKSLELCVNVYTLWFDLPLNVKPLQERLQLIDTRIRHATTRLGMRLLKIATNLVGAVISLIPQLFELSGSLTESTYISNMVGPQNYFTIFGGDLVTAMYVFSPIVIEEVVAIDSYTYGEEVTLGLVMPDRVIRKLPGFLDDFVAGIEDEMARYIELHKTK